MLSWLVKPKQSVISDQTPKRMQSMEELNTSALLLNHIKCTWFDDSIYFEFFRLHGVQKKVYFGVS